MKVSPSAGCIEVYTQKTNLHRHHIFICLKRLHEAVLITSCLSEFLNPLTCWWSSTLGWLSNTSTTSDRARKKRTLSDGLSDNIMTYITLQSYGNNGRRTGTLSDTCFSLQKSNDRNSKCCRQSGNPTIPAASLKILVLFKEAAFFVVFYYLCQGGYVFCSVGLFVRKITEKVMNGFWSNLLETAGGDK